MTLTDFLLARIAEDEEMARKVDRYLVHSARIQVSLSRTEGNITVTEMVEPYDPTRALAECEAKRRIVERCGDVMGNEDPRASLDEDGWISLMWETCYDLAAVYHDHPDYHDDWKP